MRRTRTALCGLGCAALVASSAPGAAAGPLEDPEPPVQAAVRFLDRTQWQAAAPGTAAWEDGKAQGGKRLSEYFCETRPLPADRTAHRVSVSDRSTGIQHVTQLTDVKATKRLVGRYMANLFGCLAEAAADEDTDVRVATLGRYRKAGISLLAVGAYFTFRDGEIPRHESHLFGVGRDGRLLTVIDYLEAVPRQDAPAREFLKLARQGVRQLR